MQLRLNREEIEARVAELRGEHPGRDDFVAAVKAFADTLDGDARHLLGQVLLDRKPETGAFDVISHRIDRGGWMKRTLRRIEQSERWDRER